MKRLSSPFLVVALLAVALPVFAAVESSSAPMTANGESDAFTWPKSSPEGYAHVRVWGTFDGATMTLQHSIDNGDTWASFVDDNGTAVTWTSENQRVVFADKRQFRFALTGAGGSTSLDWRIGGAR